jgi:hypothetical protein
MGNLGQANVTGMQEFFAGMKAPANGAGQMQVERTDGGERGQCSQPGCLQAGRYGLHGLRACGRACLEALLRTIVISEQADALVADLGSAPRVRLGQILIEQGSITEAQLERALRAQRATGAGRLGSWLKQQVDLSEADFAVALSIQWKCPVFQLGNFAPRRMARFLPRQLAEERGALALRIRGDAPRISICFEDHVDSVLLRAMERMHGVPVEAGLLTSGDFWQATREFMGVPFPRCASVTAPSIDDMTRAMSHVLMAFEAHDARLVAIGSRYWLRVWQSRSDTAGGAQGAGLPAVEHTLYGRTAADIGEERSHAAVPWDAEAVVALDVLCTASITGDAHRDDFPDCEELARQMLGGAKEREYNLSD